MAEARTFESNADAFEFACEQLDCSLKDGNAVLAVVLAVQGRMCSVKIANRDDKTIPTGSLNELLARTDLTHVCFSAMLDAKVSNVASGDLVMYATMPELAAAGKATVAGTVLSKVTPHYTRKAGWHRVVEHRGAPVEQAPDVPAEPGAPPTRDV